MRKIKTISQIAIVCMLVSTLLMGIIVSAPKSTYGLEMTYGEIGEVSGTDPMLLYPEMNSTTFYNYESENVIIISNDGNYDFTYWEVSLSDLVSPNYGYSMANNYTIRIYNDKGVFIENVSADDDATCVFEYSLNKKDVLYIRVWIHPPVAYAVDVYTLPFSIYAYTEKPGTRSIASDTNSGSTTLGISDTLSVGLSYTGTHTSEIYFTDKVGTTTVPSSNLLKLTNTGNVEIDQITLDVGTNVWQDSSGNPTTYSMDGNTEAKKNTETSFTTLNPSATWTFTGFTPLTFREFRFGIINANLGAGTYTATLIALIENAGLGLSDSHIVDMEYGPYAGNFETTLTYSMGSSLAFPQSAAGDTNVQTTNSAIVTNTVSSDYVVDKIEFLFQPLSDGLGHKILYGNNADLIITDSAGLTYTYALTSYLSGGISDHGQVSPDPGISAEAGINFGRALISLSDTDTTLPNDLDPTNEQLSFKVRLYSIPSNTPSGSYSGSFTVTCQANPIAVLSGLIAYPLYYQEEYFVIHPTVSDDNDENFIVGENLIFNFTVEHGAATPYNSYLWAVFYENDTTAIWDIKWTYVQMKTVSAGAWYYSYPIEEAPTHSFSKAGNYTAYIAPLNKYTQEPIYNHMKKTSFKVNEIPKPKEPSFWDYMPSVSVFQILALLLLLTLIVILLMKYKKG